MGWRNDPFTVEPEVDTSFDDPFRFLQEPESDGGVSPESDGDTSYDDLTRTLQEAAKWISITDELLGHLVEYIRYDDPTMYATISELITSSELQDDLESYAKVLAEGACEHEEIVVNIPNSLRQEFIRW